MVQELPVEIWSIIIGGVSQPDQSTCLAVSRTWREIATGLVFSRVKIHFGFGLENPWRNQNHPYVSSKDEITKMSRSWEILDRIGDDPDFARAIKDITVLAFAKGHTIFERRRALHHIIFHKISMLCHRNTIKGTQSASSFTLISLVWHIPYSNG